MTCLDADIVALFKKRVHDMAGVTPGVKVFLDGERIKIKNFEEYCALYLKSVCARAGVGAVCVCVCKCACACVTQLGSKFNRRVAIIAHGRLFSCMDSHAKSLPSSSTLFSIILGIAAQVC